MNSKSNASMTRSETKAGHQSSKDKKPFIDFAGLKAQQACLIRTVLELKIRVDQTKGLVKMIEKRNEDFCKTMYRMKIFNPITVASPDAHQALFGRVELGDVNPSIIYVLKTEDELSAWAFLGYRIRKDQTERLIQMVEEVKEDSGKIAKRMRRWIRRTQVSQKDHQAALDKVMNSLKATKK